MSYSFNLTFVDDVLLNYQTGQLYHGQGKRVISNLLDINFFHGHIRGQLQMKIYHNTQWFHRWLTLDSDTWGVWIKCQPSMKSYHGIPSTSLLHYPQWYHVVKKIYGQQWLTKWLVAWGHHAITWNTVHSRLLTNIPVQIQSKCTRCLEKILIQNWLWLCKHFHASAKGQWINKYHLISDNIFEFCNT